MKILLDANVLVYAYDTREPIKSRQAEDVLKRLHQKQTGCMSVQTLAEFMSVSQRKLKVKPDQALAYVTWFVQSWPVIDLTSQIVLEAARGVRDHALAYYDAQIWATAKLNQIPAIFSEDFNSGSTLEGVRFVNPFAPTFNLDDWT
jgi:predicted nucleic acid-binding protein